MPDFSERSASSRYRSSAGLDSVPVRWYRRPRTLVIAVVLIVVALAVFTDLPNGNQNHGSVAVSYIQAVKSYDFACVGGLAEAFTLESLVLRNQATPSQRNDVPGLLRDDLSACSYTNQSLSDMQSNLQPPGQSYGQQLGLVNACVVQWEFPDANEVISALSVLLGPPTDPSAEGALRYWDRQLALDSARATDHVAQAASDAKASLPALDLPKPPGVTLPASTGGAYKAPTQGPDPCLP